MARYLPVLLLLAACGGAGVCAGCGGDDGGGGLPSMIEFTGTFEASPACGTAGHGCWGVETYSSHVFGLDTDTPSWGAAVAWPEGTGTPCTVASDDTAWTIDCPRLGAGGNQITLTIGADLASGSVRRFTADDRYDDYRLTMINGEAL